MTTSSSTSSSLPHSRVRLRSYRKAVPLPAPLLDHCTTDLEEGLFSQGFSLLTNALTAGTESSVAAQIPQTQHLAFAATLAVHPQFTTRTTSPEKHAAADDALRYLRQVNALLGPRNSCLDKAFRFADGALSSRNKRAKTRVSDVNGLDDDGRIRSSYADEGSLWTNADDFWSVVGWAFNCSTTCLPRWERWKLLLDLLLEVLQDDLEERVSQAQATYKDGGNAAVQALLNDSLFTQYLRPIGEGRNNKRRLMRAIVANGTHTSLAEFGEIWRHETKLPKQNEGDRNAKRRKLDLENGEFGDYFDESDQDSPAGPTPRSRSTTSLPNLRQNGAASEGDDESGPESNGAKTPNGSLLTPGIETFGGTDSIRLRQRILVLLTRYCSVNPDQFLDKEDLFDLYTEFLRPLPLLVFQQFVLPTKPYLEPASQASLNQMLLRPLLAATAPVYKESPLTQAEFKAHYAPFAANTSSAVDNAKVSLLVESLLRTLWHSGALNPTGLSSNVGLRWDVEKGITARKEKVAFDGRRKAGVKAKIDEEAVAVLECSSERMLMILDIVLDSP